MNTPKRRTKKRAFRILDFLFSERKNYALLGDIEELFERQREEKSRFLSELWLWRQVVRTLVHAVFHSLYWSGVIFRNSLKITYRNFARQKLYTFINLIGLAVGMACFILIMSYVHHELGYDSFHENSDRIYRLTMEGNLSRQEFHLATSNGAVGPALAEELPEIEHAVRVRRRYRAPVAYMDKLYFDEDILWADASLFDVFSFPLLQGDPRTALEAPHSVVMTRDAALRYFEHADPIGKSLRINHSQDFTVTGVVENPPSDSHLQFDMLFSFVTYENGHQEDFSRWLGDFNNWTYLLLREGTDPRALEKKFDPMIARETGMILKAVGGHLSFPLQPLRRIHVFSRLEAEIGRTNSITVVSVYSAVALFILILACINFMNLSAARSAKRALEVGIRKVHGAVRSKLVGQFLAESLIQAFFALLLGLVCVPLGFPYFRSLVRVALPHPLVGTSWLLPAVVGLAILVGLAAGSYPAFVLSAFRPAAVLKGGAFGNASRSRFRSVLVVVQFAVSLLLLIMTGVILNQLNFMRNKDRGYERERLVVARLDNPIARRSLDIIKEEFRRLPGVVAVGASSHAPDWGARNNICQPEGFELDECPSMWIISIDHGYLDTMGIEVVEGRGFSKMFPADAEQSVLVNEAAVRRFGWDSAVGKQIRELDGLLITKSIVGVIGDFHFLDVRRTIDPMMVTLDPQRAGALVVRLAPGDVSSQFEELERVWLGVTQDVPLDAYFLETSLEMEFGREERLAGLFQSFSFLAVFIACLGLIGMAAFSTEQRTKEIGIRKVLGASSSGLVLIINKDMGKLILLANVLAWPLAYLATHRWLQDFAYRAPVPVWIFIAASTLVLALGFLTTSYHSVRAATADPVDSLRYE